VRRPARTPNADNFRVTRVSDSLPSLKQNPVAADAKHAPSCSRPPLAHFTPPEAPLADTRRQRTLRLLQWGVDLAGLALLLGFAVWAVLYWDEVPALMLFGVLLLALARLALRLASGNAK
jgi:hypothetical protein